MDDGQLWMTSLLSGVVGAVLAPALTRLLEWCRRPVLEASEADDGNEGNLIDRVSKSREREQWVRIKVRNKGNSSAQGVRVLVTEIEGSQPAQEAWTVREQVVDCYWSHLDNVTKIDIPRSTHRYADILVLRPDAQNAGHVTDFIGPGGDSLGLKPAATLKIKLALTADNAKTVTVTQELHYHGREHGFRKPVHSAAAGVQPE